MRGRDHRPAQAGDAPARGVADRRTADPIPPQGRLLDKHPLFPLCEVFGDGKGIFNQQGRPRRFPEFHELLACGAVGGYQAQDKRRPCP